jgi:solute carrier family 25 citrate transporter 1
MEFVKTRSQFGGKVRLSFSFADAREGGSLSLTVLPHKREPPLTIIRETLRSHGVRGLYAGCSALVVGNSVKAGVRFVSYDKFKQALADKDVS